MKNSQRGAGEKWKKVWALKNVNQSVASSCLKHQWLLPIFWEKIQMSYQGLFGPIGLIQPSIIRKGKQFQSNIYRDAMATVFLFKTLFLKNKIK